MPRELAAELVARLEAAPPAHVERVEIAGPGFVNFHLRETWLHEVLTDVLAGGEEGYARLDLGGGKRVNVEFVSANPTGPLHAGDGRWAAFGDSLAGSSQRSGTPCTREYYLNDRGVQMELYAASLAARSGGGASRGRLQGRLRHRVGGRDARRRRSAGVGVRACVSATSGRCSTRSTSRSTRGSASTASPSPVRSMPPSASSANTGGLRRGRRGVAPHPPTSATTRIVRSCVRTANRPPCCPTSPSRTRSPTTPSPTPRPAS